jgi:hypothetical protein
VTIQWAHVDSMVPFCFPFSTVGEWVSQEGWQNSIWLPYLIFLILWHLPYLEVTHFVHLQVSIVFSISSIHLIYTYFVHLQSTQTSLV